MCVRIQLTAVLISRILSLVYTVCGVQLCGVHIYYDLNRMESDDEATNLIKTFLNLLADYFDNQYVKVDRSVYNASRITKVLGTIARKGEESTDRPYREASLI